jgi:hypothetical protein
LSLRGESEFWCGCGCAVRQRERATVNYREGCGRWAGDVDDDTCGVDEASRPRPKSMSRRAGRGYDPTIERDGAAIGASAA